jgi:hypothetical protein
MLIPTARFVKHQDLGSATEYALSLLGLMDPRLLRPKHQLMSFCRIRATVTCECPHISSDISGYIPNKFKLLAVGNVVSTHLAPVAQLTLTTLLLSMPQLPLLAVVNHLALTSSIAV